MKVFLLGFILNASLGLQAQAGSSIQCESGQKIFFDRLISELPLGKVKVKLENFPLALGDTVHVYRVPPFSMLQVRVDTAYCAYGFVIDSVGNDFYVVGSSVSCEGNSRKLSCEIF